MQARVGSISLGSIEFQRFAAPLLIILLLAMLILPLPAFMLDAFFTLNIGLSVIVMLTSLYTIKPLDFMAFPAVLLITTMLRLALNVASTRIVLTQGHTGPDAAGKVIEAFGHFLIGGNYAVGIVVFIILTIINFVVVTKGAGRIAEVGARFALDAMPGKQMAIDADLNAGLIAEDEARKRRMEVAQEAEFYGAMDGASKYVRGDAVAGIMVTAINVFGGLIVGMAQHDMEFADALKTFTLLAIGDGLVAQIPSLVISIAAGIVVSRVASDKDIGAQLVTQLFARPQVLFITAGILGSLGLIPGMPHISFLFFAALLGSGAHFVRLRAKDATTPTPAAVTPVASAEAQDASWSDMVQVDILGLEVGYRLIALVDKAQDGDLLKRIKGIRRKFTQDVGFLSPPIHVRDNLELDPNGYRILLKGVEIGAGEAIAGRYMAIDPGTVTGPLPGVKVKDPAFGLPAVWVDESLKETAAALGYTVVDASTVVATHLNHLLGAHAAELLGRQEVQQMLDHLGRDAPKAIEEIVPKLVSLSVLQKVLQSLLAEGVHLKDMRTVLETVADVAPRESDAAALAAAVRVALGRSIVDNLFPGQTEIPVIALSGKLERMLMQASGGEGTAIEPGMADMLARDVAEAAQRQNAAGHSAVLMVPASLRPHLARFLKRAVPNLRVLSDAEIPDSKTIRITKLVGEAV